MASPTITPDESCLNAPDLGPTTAVVCVAVAGWAVACTNPASATVTDCSKTAVTANCDADADANNATIDF